VLYDWSGVKDSLVHNLVCVDAKGKLVWEAELPPGTMADCFVDVLETMESGALRANTFSCYRVILDPRNGRIIASVFTK
jgi:hypothetical protein